MRGGPPHAHAHLPRAPATCLLLLTLSTPDLALMPVRLDDTLAQAHTRTRILSVRQTLPRLMSRRRDRARSPVPIDDQIVYTRGQNAATSHRVLSVPPPRLRIHPVYAQYHRGRWGRACCIRNPSRTNTMARVAMCAPMLVGLSPGIWRVARGADYPAPGWEGTNVTISCCLLCRRCAAECHEFVCTPFPASCSPIHLYVTSMCMCNSGAARGARLTVACPHRGFFLIVFVVFFIVVDTCIIVEEAAVFCELQRQNASNNLHKPHRRPSRLSQHERRVCRRVGQRLRLGPRHHLPVQAWHRNVTGSWQLELRVRSAVHMYWLQEPQGWLVPEPWKRRPSRMPEYTRHVGKRVVPKVRRQATPRVLLANHAIRFSRKWRMRRFAEHLLRK